jgi:hypothetical protein
LQGKKAGDGALSHAEFASPRERLAWIMVVGRRAVCRARLNDVVLNQVLLRVASAGETANDVTRDVIARVQADGTCWLGGTTWHGMGAIRVSVAHWSTTEADIDRSAEAILRAVDASRGAVPPL